MSRILGAALGALLLMFGGSSALAQARPAEVPLSAWASLPAVSNVTLSDDGTRLAYARQEGDKTEIVVQQRTGEILVTVDVSDRRFSGLTWLSPDHVGITSLVLESRLTVATTYQPQLDIVNVRTKGVARALRTADRSVITAAYRVSRGEWGGSPTVFVQAVTSEGPHWTMDVYRVDLDSGRGRRIATGARDTYRHLLMPNGDVAARIASSDDGRRFRLTAPDGSGGWRTIYQSEQALDGPGVWGFGHDREHVMVSLTEGGEPVLVEIRLSDGEIVRRTSMADEPSGPFYDRRSRLVAMASEGHAPSYTFLEPRLEAGWNVMVRGLSGKRLRMGSFSEDFQTMVVHTEGPTDAGTYYLYDAAAKSVTVVGRSYPQIPPEAIGPILAVDYAAADGLPLFGYLTLPPDKQPKNLPLVVLPHGGPAARDSLSFDWWAQALASRGYAVFQPQFRGSDGFGEAFLQAGYGEWGRKMQTDVSDGVRHLAAEGMIDPERVCVVGASYGGYAALQGLATEPDVYRCAIGVGGVYDLPEMLRAEARTNPGSTDSNNPVIRYWIRFMGADSRRDTVLRELSPALRAADISGPVLLIHGRDDTVVPMEQSEIMHRALTTAGKSSKLVILDGEDHWLSYAATRRRMLEEIVAFILEHNPPD